MTREQIEQSAAEFLAWHAKNPTEPFRAYKLWVSSKAFRLVDQRSIWEIVCERKVQP